MSPERPGLDGAGRYRVDARSLPFTPSWFWEVIDTAENVFVENSLALSRTVYESPTDALAAGHEYLGAGLAPHGRFRAPHGRFRADGRHAALERRAA